MMKNKGQFKKDSNAPEEQPAQFPDEVQLHRVHHVARTAGLKALSEIKRTKKPHNR